jgi:hypothetical protein
VTGEAGEPTPSQSTRKRPVTKLAPSWEPVNGGVDWSKVKGVNPVDSAGRTIYAGADGSCYVQLPFPPGTPIGPPGSMTPPTKAVDCADPMQDPAWDRCLSATMHRTDEGVCICARVGNPPPPPTKVPCPKHAQ